jgi:hypothetical protein
LVHHLRSSQVCVRSNHMHAPTGLTDPMRLSHFLISLSHFGTMSTICYSELNNFAIVNSAILSGIIEIFAQSFYCSKLSHFAMVLSHFMILSDIPDIFTQTVFYSEHNHFATLLNHFQLFCYSELNYFFARVNSAIFVVLSTILLR